MPRRLVRSTVLGLLAAALLTLLTASPALADWLKGKVVLKSGRTYEGDIQERGQVVEVRLKFGSVKFDRADVAKIVYDDLGGTEDPGAGEKTRSVWDIRLTDGSTMRVDDFEDKGTHYLVRKKGVQLRLEKRRVANINKLEVPLDSADPEEPGPEAPVLPVDEDVFYDLEAGYVFFRPSSEWSFVRQSIEPLVRMHLQHREGSRAIQVAVTPISPEESRFREVTNDSLRPYMKVIEPSYKQRFASGGLPRGAIATFNGVSVYELSYTGRSFVDNQDYQHFEYRFFGDRHVFTITARALRKEFNAEFQAEMRQAFEGFSLLGDLVFTADRYIDLRIGFGVTVPDPSWRLDTVLFDEKTPVRFLVPESETKHVDVSVEVEPARGAAKQRMDELLAGWQKGEYFKLTPGNPRERKEDGVEIVEIEYEDFPEGGRRYQTFRHTIANVGNRFVHLRSRVSQQPEPGAEAARAHAQRLHRSFIAVSRSSVERSFESQTEAWRSFADGFKAFRSRDYGGALRELNQAIAKFDRFAAAYLLASRAAEAAGNFDEAMRLQGEAGRIAPTLLKDAGSDDLLLKAADGALKDKKFADAVRFLKAAISRGLDSDGKLKDKLLKTYLSWAGSEAGAKRYDEAEDVFEEAGRELDDRPEIEAAHFKMLMTLAGAHLKDKDFRGAKRVAKKAGRLTRDDKLDAQVDKFLERVATAEEREQNNR